MSAKCVLLILKEGLLVLFSDKEKSATHWNYLKSFSKMFQIDQLIYIN